MIQVKSFAEFRGVQGVYAIVNAEKDSDYCPFGMPYVGQSRANKELRKGRRRYLGIGNRLYDHCYRLRKRIHKNDNLQSDWDNFGENSFVFYAIEEVENVIELDQREQHWIDEWRSFYFGYNQQPTAKAHAGFFLKPKLDEDDVKAWIDQYRSCNDGKFPHHSSGKVVGSPENLTWGAVDRMLRDGFRSFEGGSSLSRFIDDQFDIVRRSSSKKYTIKQILEWAERYYKEFGYYPTKRSGSIPFAEEDGYSSVTWGGIDRSLRVGNKGLPGKDSLFRLLKRESKYGIAKETWYTKGGQ